MDSLSSKSASYKDKPHRSVFLANNFDFIVRTVQSEHALHDLLMHLDIVDVLDDQLESVKAEFLQHSWHKVVETLNRTDRLLNIQSNSQKLSTASIAELKKGFGVE